jgi:hypothetical protein
MSSRIEAPSIAMDTDDPLLEIIAHLGAALMQADYTDDQIIIGHVRSAHHIATTLRRAPAHEEQSEPGRRATENT